VSWRAIGTACLGALVLAAAGCGGSGATAEEDCDDAAGGACAAPADACAIAKIDLKSTVAERDQLLVDQQLGKATKACEGEFGADGSPAQCTAARADLEAAAAAETPPADLAKRVDDAVEACVGTTITSTIPAP
jgi:hypothetical protein